MATNDDNQSSITIIQDDLEYSLQKEDKTAFIISFKALKKDILIPRSIFYEKEEYLIMKICKESFSNNNEIRSIEFSTNSCLQVIEESSFSDSSIEILSIPKSVISLDRGWCIGAPKLTKINIDSNNPRYSIIEKKFIVSNDELVFCVRDIKNVTIPSFIKQIGAYAFNECHELRQVEIPIDSNLQIIDDYAFCNSSITSINIPFHVSRIGVGAFSTCNEIKRIEFPMNSKLQTIEKCLFSFSSIESISLSKNINKICEYAFSSCVKLTSIEIPENSKLKTIESNAFYGSNIKSITFPSKLEYLCDKWCCGIYYLNEINISPNNLHFASFDSKFIVKKSQINKENYDVLVFSTRNIETASIPSFIETIESYAFEDCFTLRSIEFSEESKLQTIKKSAFNNSTIESISIPSSVIELERGWCYKIQKLNNFTVSTNNPFYSTYNDIFIVKKSSSFCENYNSVVFCKRDCRKATIPDFIEIIEAFAFEQCFELRQIEISKDSKLKIIEEKAFCNTSIERIFIPDQLIEISESAFECCQDLKYVEISEKSELKSIGKDSFNNSSIKCFYFPPHLTQIGELAFYYCEDLSIIEIDENSEMKLIDLNVFYGCSEIMIMIPIKLADHLVFKNNI